MQQFKNKQKGVSLLEVMVSLAIGLILLLGLSSLYITSNQGVKTRSTNEILDENARQIFDRLQQDLNMAGYVDVFDLNAAQKIAKPSDDSVQRNYGRMMESGVAPVNRPKTSYEVIFGKNPVDGTDTSLTIRYQVASADGQSKASLYNDKDVQSEKNSNNHAIGISGIAADCNGGTIDLGVRTITNIYSHQGAGAANNLANTFSCLGSNTNGGQPLVHNVMEMTFRYLVTEEVTDAKATIFDSPAGLYVDKVLTAAGVNASRLQWSGVTGVEVCVVIAGEPLEGTTMSDVARFQTTLPTCVRDENNANVFAADNKRANGDTKLYRRYVKTLSIPNALYFLP